MTTNNPFEDDILLLNPVARVPIVYNDTHNKVTLDVAVLPGDIFIYAGNLTYIEQEVYVWCELRTPDGHLVSRSWDSAARYFDS